ncbi:MAG TPA: hypothetical protein VFG87_28035 [Amycolatopsis sp.]|nr:hypothetical protein [Amycolatopsis sp.]
MTFTPLVLMDCRLYLDGADLTGYSNKAELAAKPAKLTRTTFADGGSNTYVGGVFDGTANLEGFWQAGDLSQPDDSFWTNLGTSTVPLTGVPTGGAVGDLAYLTRGLETQYQPGAKHGELMAWTASLETNWPIARGKILHPQGTARTATGNGTGVQLGAVDANHALYVNLHVMSYVDGSLTVNVQDSVDNTFGSPHASGSFTAATALGGQTLKIAGGITNTWWRITWTITGGVTHSFLFAVSAGIGPK